MHAGAATTAALIGACNCTIGCTATDLPNPTFSIALVKSSDCDWPGLKFTVTLGPTAAPCALAKLNVASHGSRNGEIAPAGQRGTFRVLVVQLAVQAANPA